MNHEMPVDAGIESGEGKPLALFAGMLPFILFGLMFTLFGVDYSRRTMWIARGLNGYLVLLALLLLGVGTGWARRFPRWSYAYVGAALVTSHWLAGVVSRGYRLFGHTFGSERWGWRGWLPLLVTAAVLLLYTRSWQPLRQMVKDVRHDWTRLSFALYAAVTWLLMSVTYDGKTWYNQVAYLAINLSLLTVAVSGGAFYYMRCQRPWPRALALTVSLILYVPVSSLVMALDGHQELGSPKSVAGWTFFLLVWLTWLTVPLWPGVASLVWRRFRAL